MALIQKNNPINEDVVIAKIQTELYNNLSAKGFTSYESYERVYVVNGVPELYLGNGNYKEVFFDDRFNLTSFFLLGNTKEIDKIGTASIELGIIFQANLSKLYPTILHRADAEFHADITDSLNQIPIDFDLISVVTGFDNVYNGLTIENKQYLDDMSRFHLVRFNLKINFLETCKN